ncbi:molybdenum cofactor guanylyltransferase [Pseudoxanthomonas sp. UTMC 1351]|uniref:molybdenum cofactor guanylyltransferase n=1 Tax=Pseudoxanthomonas sp. UTMC 1351 TaxID=2695853 RepID=UPI0034CFC755
MTGADEAVVGVVLAGGRSSRMGRDKAMLSWRGDTLLAHMQRCLRSSGVSRVIVSGAYPDCEAVPDRFADLGPLGGLASVAAALPDTVLLVVPVDMPLISAEVLRHLRASPAADCVCFQGQPLPLRFRLDASSRQVLAALLEGSASGRSLRALHAALHGERLALPIQWQAQLQDTDTPADWRAIAGT